MDSEKVNQDSLAEELYLQLKETDTEAFPPSTDKAGLSGGE